MSFGHERLGVYLAALQNDPVLPSNGFEGRNWADDFQLTLHIQDDVRVVRDSGNLTSRKPSR